MSSFSENPNKLLDRLPLAFRP